MPIARKGKHKGYTIASSESLLYADTPEHILLSILFSFVYQAFLCIVFALPSALVHDQEVG